MSNFLCDEGLELSRALTGCWSAGERLLSLGDKPVWVNVWFHLFEGGEAIVSMRYLDQPPSRVHGRWSIEDRELVASIDGGEIRAAFELEGDVLRWAGETLLRLADRTASLPFGIELPYRVSLPGPLARA